MVVRFRCTTTSHYTKIGSTNLKKIKMHFFQLLKLSLNFELAALLKALVLSSHFRVVAFAKNPKIPAQYNNKKVSGSKKSSQRYSFQNSKRYVTGAIDCQTPQKSAPNREMGFDEK